MSDILENPNGKSWNSYVLDVTRTAARVDDDQVMSLWNFVLETYRRNRTLYVAGNGGCFSLAAHLAVDWSKGSVSHGPVTVTSNRRMKVTQLGANGSTLSAWANDSRFDTIYKEDLITLTTDRDYSLLVLSCSGNSANILTAAEFAARHGADVYGMVAFDGGQLMRMIDCLHVATNDYRIGEDCFHMIMHYLVSKLKEIIVGVEPKTLDLGRLADV